jgi:DNA-binding transcriptional regulator YdaS (Cro superfamily)
MENLKQYLEERGRLTALANAIGVTPSAIAQWKRVPAERTRDVSRATGIPKHVLRPDLFDNAGAE